MADINVERKRRSIWPLLLALLLVAAIAIAAWWYLGSQNRGGAGDTAPAAEVQNSPSGTPAPMPGTIDPTVPPPGGSTDATTAPPSTTTGY